MKKILFIVLFSFVTLVCNAQIYNKIEHYDKFDDVIKTENVKTLVTKTDSTFVIETKGRKPVTYYIMKIVEGNCIGDSEVNNHERLVKNVFGYQECYFVADIPFEAYMALLRLDEERAKNHVFGLVHRVISRYDFTFEYDTEYLWLQDFNRSNSLGRNIDRIVYSISE